MNAPATPTVPARPPGPRLGISLITIGLGVAMAIAAGVAIVIPVLGAFTSPAYSVPGELRMHLDRHRYTVYQYTGTRSLLGTTHTTPVARILPSEVAVSAPDGSQVAVDYDPRSDTLTRGTSLYEGSLVFDAPQTGEYDLRFANAEATTVVVARSVADSLRHSAGWFVVGGVGTIVLVGGVVMLAVGVTRRSRARRALQVGWAAPGWGQPWGQPGWSQGGWGQGGSGPPRWGQPGWGQGSPPPGAPPPPAPPPPPDAQRPDPSS